MTAGWEYLCVDIRYFNHAGLPATVEVIYEVWRPGATDPERRSGIDVTWPALLNELGTAGWELTTASMVNTTVVARFLGWPEVGVPVTAAYTFKRPAVIAAD